MKNHKLILLLLLALSGCGSSTQDSAGMTGPVQTAPTATTPAPSAPSVPVIEANKSFQPSRSSGITAEPQIADFYFMEHGGRPGHEGSFRIRMLPLNAGSQIILTAKIFGEIASASYTMKNKAGVVLASAPLVPSDLRYTFSNKIVVPSETFTLQIAALGVNGKTVNANAPVPYETLGTKTSINPDSALLTAGVPVGVTIDVASTTVAGPFIVSLVLPAGFQSDAGPWSTTLAPGSKASFRANATAPAGQEPYSAFTFRAVLQAQDGSDVKQYAQTRMIVK